MNIDSTNVASGTFTDANATGTLVPDDGVIIDGRIFIIGSVMDGRSPLTQPPQVEIHKCFILVDLCLEKNIFFCFPLNLMEVKRVHTFLDLV